MNYSSVVQVVEQFGTLGWQVHTLAQADGYTTYALVAPALPEPAPKLLIAAGIHGEEPGAVLGTLQWLQQRAEAWSDQIHLTVLPCINPWGIERGIRFGPHGKDLNREFDAPVHPYAKGVTDFLKGRRFDLFMDQHEDCDFLSMYVYENGGRADVSLGRRILSRAEKYVPLSHGEEVGPFVTDRGMVNPVRTPEDLGDLSHLEGYPIALYLLVEHVSHVVTVETPGLQPIDVRAQIHVESLDEACTYLVDQHEASRMSS